MATLKIDNLYFNFQKAIAAEKYDDWIHYRTVWNKHGNQKAVDVVAMRRQANPAAVYLIEAKDFRQLTGEPNRLHVAGLAEDVLKKVQGTLAGLAHAADFATADTEREHAARAMNARTRRVVLHVEPYDRNGRYTRLFPANFPANVFQKLKQLVRAVDSNPLLVNMSNCARLNLPWTVSKFYNTKIG